MPFGENKMKQKLQEILKNPAGKLLAIDMDGTICKGEFWGGSNCLQKPYNIHRNRLKTLAFYY